MFNNMTRCIEYQSGQTSLSLYCSYICDSNSDFDYYNECMYTSQVCSNIKQFDLEYNCSLISSTWFKNYDQCANYTFSFNRTGDPDNTNGGSMNLLPMIVIIVASCCFICLIQRILFYFCQEKSKILMSLVIFY